MIPWREQARMLWRFFTFASAANWARPVLWICDLAITAAILLGYRLLLGGVLVIFGLVAWFGVRDGG